MGVAAALGASDLIEQCDRCSKGCRDPVKIALGPLYKLQ